jgi:tetratricopeptide (TPR) repeat protein
MSDNDKYTETIIRYLDGELTGVDLKSFEELLRENGAVQQELDNLRLALKAVRSYGLKTEVASVHDEMMQELKAEKKSSTGRAYPFLRSTLKIAASLLFILLSICIYQYSTVSPSKLYNDNYRPYKESVSRGTAGTTELEKAYIDGKPGVVTGLFEKVKSADNKTDFLAAQSYLALHHPGKAIEVFKRILTSPPADLSFRDDAEYYLALAYLGNNQPGQAREFFKKIYGDKDHPYHDRVSYWLLLKLKLLSLKTAAK